MPPQDSDRSRSPRAASAIPNGGDALGGARGANQSRQEPDAGYSSRDDLQRFARPQPRGQGPVRKPTLRTQKRPKFDRDRYAHIEAPRVIGGVAPVRNDAGAAPTAGSDSALDRLLAARALRDGTVAAPILPNISAKSALAAIVQPAPSVAQPVDAKATEQPSPDARPVPIGSVSVALTDQSQALPAESFYDPTMYADEEAARAVEDLQREFETADAVVSSGDESDPAVREQARDRLRNPAVTAATVGVAEDARVTVTTDAVVNADAGVTAVTVPTVDIAAWATKPSDLPVLPTEIVGLDQASLDAQAAPVEGVAPLDSQIDAPVTDSSTIAHGRHAAQSVATEPETSSFLNYWPEVAEDDLNAPVNLSKDASRARGSHRESHVNSEVPRMVEPINPPAVTAAAVAEPIPAVAEPIPAVPDEIPAVAEPIPVATAEPLVAETPRMVEPILASDVAPVPQKALAHQPVTQLPQTELPEKEFADFATAVTPRVEAPIMERPVLECPVGSGAPENSVTTQIPRVVEPTAEQDNAVFDSDRLAAAAAAPVRVPAPVAAATSTSAVRNSAVKRRSTIPTIDAYLVRRALMYIGMVVFTIGFLGFLIETIEHSDAPWINSFMIILVALVLIPVAVPDRKVADPARVNIVRIPGYIGLLALVALCAAGFTSGNLIMAIWPIVIIVAVTLVRFSPRRRNNKVLAAPAAPAVP